MGALWDGVEFKIDLELRPEECLGRAAMGLDVSPRFLRDRAPGVAYLWEQVCSRHTSCSLKGSLEVLFGQTHSFALCLGWALLDPCHGDDEDEGLCPECLATLEAPFYYAIYVAWIASQVPEEFPVLRGIGVVSLQSVLEALSDVKMSPQLRRDIEEIMERLSKNHVDSPSDTQ